MPNMTREELILLVSQIIDFPRSGKAGDHLDEMLRLFSNNVPHPSPVDLISFNPGDVTAEEVVDKALSYEPLELP